MLLGLIPDEVFRVWALFACFACIAVWRLQNKVKAAVKQHDPDGQFRGKLAEAGKERILDWLKKK